MDQQTNELIKNEIENNDVCLFMKGTPDAPQCGFSMAVSNMLKILEVNFKGVNVLEDQNLRQGIKDFSDWPTIPQLYIKGEFIGGCDIVKDMFEKGELKKVLEEKKLIKEAMPDAKIEIQDLAGDGNHYSATVTSSTFAGKSKIEQHKMVYNSLKGRMGNELHALAIKTKE